MGLFTDIIIAATVILAAAAAGIRPARRLGVPRDSAIETFCAGAALGLGALSVSVFFLGIAGLIHRWSMALLLLIFLAAGLRGLFSCFVSICRSAVSFVRNAGPLTLIPAALTAVFFILYVPFALMPPIQADSLSYHLAAPKIYAGLGKLVFLPDNYRASFPSGVHMLYTLTLALGGHAAAQLLHLGMGVLCSISLYTTGRLRLDRTAGAWAAFAFSSLYTLSLVAPQAMTELGYTLFAVLAFHYLLEWNEEGGGRLALAALFCGLALSTRYQAAVWALCLGGMLVLIEKRRNAPARRAVSDILLFAAIALAVTAPWLVRNLVNTGNPVFPLFNQYFGGRYFDPVHGPNMIASVSRPASLLGNIKHLVLYPWLATVHGFSADTGAAPPFSPLFLGLLPGLLFFRPLPRRLSAALWFCIAFGAVSWCAWLIVPRFWLPASALLCLGIGFLVSAAARKSPALLAVILFFIAVHTAFVAGTVVTGRNSLPVQLSVLTGTTSVDDYFRPRVQAYSAIQTANKILPGDAKVLLGFDTGEGYYLDRPYIYGTLTLQGYLEWYKLRDGHQLIGWLKNHGVTHIIFSENFAKPGFCAYRFQGTPTGVCASWEYFIKNHLIILDTVDEFIVGEIKY